MLRGCDCPASPLVTVNKDAQAQLVDACDAPIAAVAPRRRARRMIQASAHISPIRSSSSTPTDAVLDEPPPCVSRKTSPAHRLSASAANTQHAGKHIRSSNASHKTMEQVGYQQFPLFAELAPENASRSEDVAEMATTRSGIEDEIQALRGYLSSRLDEKGLPRDDTALLDGTGVEYSRLARLARRLATLEAQN